MSVEQQVSPLDNPLTFSELYQDFYNQRVSSQVSDGTLGIYGYTVRRFCIWADKQGFSPLAVERGTPRRSGRGSSARVEAIDCVHASGLLIRSQADIAWWKYLQWLGRASPL
jgi:Rod binding domain-containing protein